MIADFDLFKDTSVYERYMLNMAQFSAAKNIAETKMLQQSIFKDGERVSYSAFKKEAKQITDIFQDTWLRTEYDTAVKQAVQGDLFRRYRDDADLYPYWRYLRTISFHPRDEHLQLVGNVYRIGDPQGDMVIPPGGFNCGCGSENLSDSDIESEGVSVRTSEQSAKDLLDVSPQFRFNPADQGILPKESHSYFEVLKSANAGKPEMFGYTRNGRVPKTKLKGLHNFVKTVNDWRGDYHTTQSGDIIFQNKDTWANVKFNNASLHNIQNHANGFEQLPDTIANPDEIWSLWVDPEKQMSVNRVYIKGDYAVLTTDGVVKDAYLGDVHQYRKGILI